MGYHGIGFSAAFLNRFNFVYLTGIYAWARLKLPTSGDLVVVYALHRSEAGQADFLSSIANVKGLEATHETQRTDKKREIEAR